MEMKQPDMAARAHDFVEPVAYEGAGGGGFRAHGIHSVRARWLLSRCDEGCSVGQDWERLPEHVHAERRLVAGDPRLRRCAVPSERDNCRHSCLARRPFRLRGTCSSPFAAFFSFKSLKRSCRTPQTNRITEGEGSIAIFVSLPCITFHDMT